MIKQVNKHWGKESWIQDGQSTPYAFKRIMFLAGHRTSLQVHRKKIETNYVLKGKGTLLLSKVQLDIDKFLIIGMSEQEIKDFESQCENITLEQDMNFTIYPGYVHRVTAITDLEFFEVSSPELDDVYRLQDDHGRTHGRIQSEHK